MLKPLALVNNMKSKDKGISECVHKEISGGQIECVDEWRSLSGRLLTQKLMRGGGGRGGGAYNQTAWR